MSRKPSATNILVKLLVPAGSASPSPPVGPALGSKGVKSIDFCKEFNARTAAYLPNTPIPALVTVRPDRSFTFELRTPPTASLLLIAAGVAPLKNRIRGAGNTAGPNLLRSLVAQRVAARKAPEAPGRKEVVVEAEEDGDEEEESEEYEDEEEGEGEGEGGGGMYSVTATGKAEGNGLTGNGRVGTVGTVSLKHVYEIARIKATEPRLASLGLENIAKSIVAQAGSMGVVVVP